MRTQLVAAIVAATVSLTMSAHAETITGAGEHMGLPAGRQVGRGYIKRKPAFR